MNGHPQRQEWMIRLWRLLAHQAVLRPWLALLIIGLITLAAGTGTTRLKLRTDGHALVNPKSPEVLFDRYIRDQFGVEDRIVIVICSNHPDGIFNPDTLQLVRDLTASLAEVPGINPSNIMSLATEPGLRHRAGSLAPRKLLEAPMTTKAELDQLRDDIRRIRLYTGTLVAFDGRSTVILLGTPSDLNRTRLYEQVLDRISAVGEVPEKIAVTGAPVAESLLGLHILEDLGVSERLLGISMRSNAVAGEWQMPSTLHEFRRFIAHRIGLIPVAVLVMVLVFFAAFRNVVAALLPLPVVASVLLFVFGLMGWLGVPIYLTTAVMPVLLTAMCVTDEIHLFSRYLALLREKMEVGHVEMIKQTLDELVRPVVMTTLTTAVGFLSFALSPLAPVRTFGVFTAVGMLFSLLCTLMMVPALLALISPRLLRSSRARRPDPPSRLEGWCGQLSLHVVRYRRWVLGLLLMVVILAPLGLRRLVVQDSWVDAFDPSTDFRRITEFVNEQYHGMHLLLVSFYLPQTLRGELPVSAVTSEGIALPNLAEHPTLFAGSPITITPVRKGDGAESSQPALQSRVELVYGFGGEISARVPKRDLPENFQTELNRADQIEFEVVVHSHVRPEVMREIADLASFIRERRQYAVGGVLSPYDYLETTRFMSHPDNPNARQLPADPGEIKRLWDYYGLGLGQHRLRQIVDTNYWRSLTTIFLKDANFQDTARLMDDLRAYERRRLAPKGIQLGFAGDVAVSQSLIHGIVNTQLQSLAWSLLGIYAVTALLGRSWRWGVYAVLPSALAVLVNFVVMGWFGIPVGVATSMFAGMTLGLGVDFAIHMLEGYRMVRTTRRSALQALRRAMEISGPPVLVNTLAIALGFGVLLLSQVPANARLGLLLVLALVNCLFASVLIVPMLLHWRTADFSEKERRRR